MSRPQTLNSGAALERQAWIAYHERKAAKTTGLVSVEHSLAAAWGRQRAKRAGDVPGGVGKPRKSKQNHPQGAKGRGK